VVTVRRATVDDAAAVAALYNYEVEHTTSTLDLVPRTLADQRAWIAERSGAFTVVVAERDGHVVGFSSLSAYKERAAYRGTVEDSVYVHRDVHGLGVGRLLLTAVVDHAEAAGFHVVMARIEASGAASRRLHERCGFDLVGVEREVGRKFNRWLDVAVYHLLLPRPRRGDGAH
jgi:L-amino acid N-acyltransferase